MYFPYPVASQIIMVYNPVNMPLVKGGVRGVMSLVVLKELKA
jgi:hypothetical protein